MYMIARVWHPNEHWISIIILQESILEIIHIMKLHNKSFNPATELQSIRSELLLAASLSSKIIFKYHGTSKLNWKSYSFLVITNESAFISKIYILSSKVSGSTSWRRWASVDLEQTKMIWTVG